MQEIFNQIIEKMRESAIERYSNDGMGGEMVVKLDKAIEIVKQAAIEYSNGWIPVESGKLPEEYAGVEVTIEEITNDVDGKQYYAVRSWLQEGQWAIKKAPYNPKVIAWKYPTEPYRPKGE